MAGTDTLRLQFRPKTETTRAACMNRKFGHGAFERIFASISHRTLLPRVSLTTNKNSGKKKIFFFSLSLLRRTGTLLPALAVWARSAAAERGGDKQEGGTGDGGSKAKVREKQRKKRQPRAFPAFAGPSCLVLASAPSFT